MYSERAGSQEEHNVAAGMSRPIRQNVKKQTKKERIAAEMRRQHVATKAARESAWWADDISRAERQLTIKQGCLRDAGDWIGVNAEGASTTFFTSMEECHATEVFLGTDEEEVGQDSIQAMYNALKQGQPPPETGSSASSSGRIAAAANAAQEPPGAAETERGEQLKSEALS